jgi:hypothetical protein
MTFPTNGFSSLQALQLKAAGFNNSGTNYFRSGEYQQAWVLFKGALEVELAIERVMPKNKPRSSSDREINTADESEIENGNNCVDTCLHEALSSNSFIQVAESLMSSSVQSDPSLDEAGLEMPALMDSSFEEDSDSESVSYEDVEIHRTAFKVLVDATSMQDRFSWQLDSKVRSAKIIFNLALVEHVVDPSSQNVVSLYELSSKLLSKEYITDLVQVAVINNIAVWFYENDNADAAQVCMEYLSKEINAQRKQSDESLSPTSATYNHNVAFVHIPKKLMSLIKSNIEFILAPSCTVSAAA